MTPGGSAPAVPGPARTATTDFSHYPGGFRGTERQLHIPTCYRLCFLV